MVTFLRHLLAIVVLPFTMTILVPIWITRRYEVDLSIPSTPSAWALSAAGFGVLAVGLILFVASLFNFATRGRGTLAPWDPPRELVVQGPYRWVRNPMISGVILVLFGEALALRSTAHALWAATFLAINLTYIPLLEEPQLEQRFGDDYGRYKRNVPRFPPRLRPWDSETG